MALKDKIMERAQSFLQKGYLDKAIVEYKAAFDADPRDISIRLRVGDLYVKMGKKTEAVEEYKEVAKANNQRGFYLKAIAVYKQVLKLEDTNYEVHYKLAELYAKQRLISDAIGEYSLLVSSFEKKGKTGEVMQLLKEMLDIDADNIGVRMKLAELYQKLNFENDALGEYAIIFKKYMTQDKLDKAEKVFTTLYKTYPKDIRILKGLSELYSKRRDDEKFIKYTKAAFKLYVERHDKENAKAVCDAILAIASDDIDCLRYLGRAPSAPEPSKAAPLIAFPGDAAKIPPHPPSSKEGAAAPLISFPELGEPAKQEEPSPLISFPELSEPPKPEEMPSLPQSEEEPMISFPDSDGNLNLDGSVNIVKEVDRGESLIDLEPEMFVTESGVSEDEKGPSETKAPEVPFEMPGAAAQREVDAIFGSVAKDVSDEGSVRAEVTKGSPSEEEEASEEITFEVTPESAHEEASEEIAFEVTPEAAHEDVSEEMTFEVAPEAAHEEVSEEIAFEVTPDAEEPKEEVEEEIIFDAGHEEASVEAVAEHVEPPPSEGQEKSVFTHDDLAKSITELTEHHDLIEMVEEPAEETVKEDISSVEAMVTEEPESGGGGDFVDLSKELGMEDALSDLVGAWGAGNTKESYDEFKTGMGNQLNKEDSETHFNLGIAYMEMELISEATKEFKIALKDPLMEFDCYTRLALCAMSEGNPDEAIVYYTKGLRVANRSDDERKGMMYELALAYESADRLEEAGKLYLAVSAVDPNYRDIVKKVRLISGSVRSIPMSDGMLEVELM